MFIIDIWKEDYMDAKVRAIRCSRWASDTTKNFLMAMMCIWFFARFVLAIAAVAATITCFAFFPLATTTILGSAVLSTLAGFVIKAIVEYRRARAAERVNKIKRASVNSMEEIT